MADPTMNRQSGGLDLTPETQAEIWQTATYQSAFMQLVPQINLPGRGVRVPIITGDPEADWVQEGAEKPKSGVGFSRKDMVPYTIAVILPFSNQFRRDFDALYAQIVAKGPGAIARKIDQTIMGLGDVPGADFDTLAAAPQVQLGKTFTLGTAMFITCILKPGLKVIWTAHHTRTSDETFADLCDLARNRLLSRYVERIRLANGQQEITFRNRSRIMFGARENGFGRGLHSVDVEIFDEAQILTVRALDNMLPIVNVRPDPLVVFLCNPPKPRRSERGVRGEARGSVERHRRHAVCRVQRRP
ncbi:phage major capsid protein [Bifidobacterium simiarum]|uniref:phage major capsid protein n=1 Tax=Bifidobacterium simiarum TaxID=2045441 RepID=UPI001BDC9C9A|nr:phage major capsid protein [Bifidobacterium simiarum]MBT1166727.1 phage major capsid protein [Bifidobacterium simiarum]